MKWKHWQNFKVKVKLFSITFNACIEFLMQCNLITWSLWIKPHFTWCTMCPHQRRQEAKRGPNKSLAGRATHNAFLHIAPRKIKGCGCRVRRGTHYVKLWNRAVKQLLPLDFDIIHNEASNPKQRLFVSLYSMGSEHQKVSPSWMNKEFTWIRFTLSLT